jgi:hypothetical protein
MKPTPSFKLGVGDTIWYLSPTKQKAQSAKIIGGTKEGVIVDDNGLRILLHTSEYHPLPMTSGDQVPWFDSQEACEAHIDAMNGLSHDE